MSPARRRHLALFSALGILFLTFYYWALLLFFIVILAFLYIILQYHGQEALPARLGLNPRARVSLQTGLWRWLSAWGGSGVLEPPRRLERYSSGKNKPPFREPAQPYGHRLAQTGPYRAEALSSESLMFSPRDLLMGSYISKADSPPANSLRARTARNPREQLRDGLAKPNYAVYTPNRRLSFTGEPLGSGARFTITPQRHYPLQQQEGSPVGVLPPLRWDSFRHKNVLSPRNSMSSPVTVKIARPDEAAHSLDQVGSPVFPIATADPCSRESVLKVLKESRKREVDEEEGSLSAQQRSKRRRNDSGGSAQSAFESLLPNGTSTQLIPKPGNLKRALTVSSEEQVKRSRTSSVSSSSGAPTFRGTPSSRRNPITSSYSSSKGLGQQKRPWAPSVLSSPGASRPHTPEGSSKRAREEEQKCPSPKPSVKPDRTSGQMLVLDASSSPPAEPGTSTTERTGSGGNRKRKIQLITRDESLTLPPPPELGYIVTVKDLDEEKLRTLSKIHNILETPAPEPASSSLPSSIGSSETLSTPVTLSGFLSASARTTSSSLDASAGGSLGASAGGSLGASAGGSLGAAAEAAGGSLGAAAEAAGGSLGASAVAAGGSLGASAVAAGGSLGASAEAAGGSLGASAGGSLEAAGGSSAERGPAQLNILLESLKRKSPAPVTATVTVSAQAQSAVVQQVPPVSTSLVSSQQPSAPAPASAPAAAPAAAPSSASTAATVTPSQLTSFKPIFTYTSTADDPKPLQNFKPIFGLTPESGVSTPASSSVSTAGMFSSSSSTTTASVFSPSTMPVSGAMFGSSSGSSLQVSNPPSSSQSGLSFVQAPLSSTNTFEGFGTTTTPAPLMFGTTTTQAPPPYGTTTTQDPPPYGITSIQAPHAFGGSKSTQAPPTFGSTASTQAPPTFGSTMPTQAPPTFGITMSTQAPPTFGSTMSTQAPPTFGSTMSTQAPPTFGSTMSTQAPPTFGSTMSSQAPPTFGSTMSTQAPPTFGSTMSSQAPPTFGSTMSSQSNSFGTTTSTFTFGKSSLESSSVQPSFISSTEPAKPFTFGAASSTPASQTAPSALGVAPSTALSFGTLSKPSFSFGSTTTVAPGFGTEVAPQSSNTFTFGSTAPQSAAPNAQPSTPFKFGAAAPPQFGTPVNNTAPQMGAFSFGAANSDKPAFGTPAPTFLQTPAPIPFGSPATLGQNFNAAPFGSPVTPSFSIGAGSKSASRQRLQARRPHTRKK
ncbi:nuclear envelope pore membrane protein POM 121 isoform X2 [Eucyclogobius newberryi]|uniref:nuclear envelope pore membrane protein POM 121 isoform X2 n=1 Tax=Eucyclogobius newberryi TaxID=166745 RepID=UPI003B58D2AE